MVDETFDRLYLEGRGELHKAIESGFRALGCEIMAAFRTLHRIEWEAPWGTANGSRCK